MSTTIKPSRHKLWVSILLISCVSFGPVPDGVTQTKYPPDKNCWKKNYLPGQRGASAPPALLYWALKLQQNVDQNTTAYRHGSGDIGWGEHAPYHCYTDCSGFLNALISKSFNWNDEIFRNELGHSRMYAWHYYTAIATGNHFTLERNIHAVCPGDIIALQYADRSEHEDNTGHVMVVASYPRVHTPSKIILAGTNQYEVDVIDCSRSPHGKEDSRILGNGGQYSGVGKGVFRLYTDLQGNITGYSWSIGRPKEGFDPLENPIAVGRFSDSRSKNN